MWDEYVGTEKFEGVGSFVSALAKRESKREPKPSSTWRKVKNRRSDLEQERIWQTRCRRGRGLEGVLK